ncbi:hypothetical protein ACOMHN_051988 [Nucella lapillus]
MGVGKGIPVSVLKSLDTISLKGKYQVDDFSDKLISHIFVYVLILFAVIAGIHEYTGNALECLPKSKDGSMQSYMRSHLNSFCLTHTLYYYDDFWRNTRLPPVKDSKASKSSPSQKSPGSRLTNISTTTSTGSSISLTNSSIEQATVSPTQPPATENEVLPVVVATPTLTSPGTTVPLDEQRMETVSGAGEASVAKDLPHDTNHPVLTSDGETLYASEVTHVITVVFVLQMI